jgi:hypothetical protein
MLLSRDSQRDKFEQPDLYGARPREGNTAGFDVRGLERTYRTRVPIARVAINQSSTVQMD